MAVAQGYGKIVTSGSVFAYDVGDTRNSYRGKPTTNLLTAISKGNTNQALFKILPGTEVKNVPGMGTRTVEYVDVYNDYNGGSGNCCPAPMHFGDFTVTPSTEYTYQIIYKTSTGYAHPNYMYHYEYNGGTYVTEYGLWNGSRQTDLGDGWKHAWGTFTSNASTNRFICYLFHYEYGTQNRIEVAGVMLTQGNAILPPNQFIPINTTRSATQGLLPLVGNSTIDLTNVSFDSNAKMVFDGTNDTISVTSYPAIELVDNVSIEYVYMRLSTDSILDVIANKYHSTGWELFCTTANTFALAGRNGDGTYYSTTNAAYTIQNNKYYHLVAMKEGLSWRLYVNGELYAYLTANSVGTWSNTGILQIGGEGSGYYPNMESPVFKIYSRALTAAEVNQNYRHYKTRFNLS
jgi:hypothetical protein